MFRFNQGLRLHLLTKQWRSIFNIWGMIQHCLICEDPSSERICTRCLPYFKQPRYACQKCAIPLLSHALLCGECLKKPPSYDYAYSPYLYAPPLDKLITAFKYNAQYVAGKALGELFSQALFVHYQQDLRLPDYVTSVPLFWQRQWRRGFNQSALLANTIAHQLGLPYINCAKRIRKTEDQKSLSRKVRLYNLRHSFKVTRVFEGESIAIVDDVMTTGATVETLAKALKEAGAGTVIVWALARTSCQLRGQ